MLAFFRKKNSDSEIGSKVGSVRSVVVGADVSFFEEVKKIFFVYISFNFRISQIQLSKS